MKIHHSRSHWVMVALVLAAFLLTLSEAHGQSPGVPQGGIGVQGSEAAAIAGTDTDTAERKDNAPSRDKSLAKDQRSSKKAVRGVKRSISRARHGNAPVDAATQ